MNIGDSGNIFVEKAHPAYAHVIDFLVSCCEPVSRTQHMEQYRMDSSSLSAATAEGTYSLAMIETILRHFRLNDAQELPVDLERCSALEQLVTTLDEMNVDVEEATEKASTRMAQKQTQSNQVAASPTSATPSAFSAAAAHAPLPPCLEGVDFTGTSLAAVYPRSSGSKAPAFKSDASTCTPNATPAPAIAVKAEATSDEQVPSATPLVAAATPASPRRVLQLFRPSSSPSPPPPATSPGTVDAAATSPGRPLIAVAVTHPEEVQRPLPAAIAKMLVEEENTSRVQIVLQPRLRRFHQFSTGDSKGGSAASSSGRAQRGSGAEAAEDQQLFYFIESRQRAHLELVLDALKEFLEPVLLYGKERWILSDVDRSPAAAEPGSTGASSASDAARLARDAGRPAVLRMLYQPPNVSSATGDGSKNAAGGGGITRAQQQPASRFIYKCQVKDGKLREVKERLFAQFDIRADCYYDYLQDKTLHVDNLALASHVRLRPYQVASLERFRRGRKAHQGVVVLPCGAGKTLTGIGAAAAMQKTTIVMCVNNMSVFQWQREFLRWTDLTEEEVTVCTAKVKQKPGKVFITTYSMVIAKRGRSDGAAAEESRAILRAMTAQPWGLLLLDEVHTALAHHFQDVLNTIKYKCVLGLSATLLREDDKIGDLRHLVGPKLYEANWLDLTRAGFLANVECAEVQCPMPLPFLQAYRDVQKARVMLGAGKKTGKRPRHDDDDGDTGDGAQGRGGGRRGRQATWGGLNSRALHLASCNPYKLWCTQALLAFHQQRSPPDKVIIFCDYLADVRFFAHHLHLPFMDQQTSETERTNLLQYFQHSSEVNAIILTRVGDVALDLPCASVIIQVSGLGASRRQEAQRLGRILRPKPPSLDNTCAYFYTLVSQDTGDIRTSYKRQSWLRDQGFAYRILHSDSVLSEFLRVGGQPCCVGPPQWWYQSTAPATTAAQGAHLSSKPGAQPSATAVRGEDGLYWSPFSPEAALKVEMAFQRGKPSCSLRGSELGTATARPSAAELGGYALRSSESWEVTFSSVDAPQTFGTVLIGEGSAASGVARVGAAAASPSVPSRVRRIRRGCLDRAHRCDASAGGHDDRSCLSYALSVVAGARGARDDAAAVEATAAATLSGSSSDYDDDDGDDDLLVRGF